MKDKILQWYVTGQRGSSSEAMAACFAGIQSGNTSHPYDPADFNRCLLFLAAVPEARENMQELFRLSPQWMKLVSRWDELESVFLEEVGLNWSKGCGLHAEKTYSLMKLILG
jgi:hypothetical protein